MYIPVSKMVNNNTKLFIYTQGTLGGKRVVAKLMRQVSLAVSLTLVGVKDAQS